MQNGYLGLYIAGMVVALVIMCVASCVTFIAPGNVGVVVNMFGDKKGVDDKELSVGAHVIPPWKKLYTFPTFEQNYCWEGRHDCFHFQTHEGLGVFADIGITYRIQPSKVHEIFCRYRRGIDEITHTFIRNYIRDGLNKAASRFKIEDLYSDGKSRFLDEVQSHVINDLKEIGIDVSRIYLIGRFQFPDRVVAALNLKIEAMQRAEQRENELREAEAEARKVMAAAKGESESVLIQARAQAEANKLLSESLTDALIKQKALDKWNGELPRVVSSEASLLLGGDLCNSY